MSRYYHCCVHMTWEESGQSLVTRVEHTLSATVEKQ